MRPFATVALSFSIAVLVALVSWSTASVYVLESYEHAWGHGGTVQVLWGLSIMAALLTLVGSAIGARLAQPPLTASRLAASIAGLCFGALSVGLLWLSDRLHIEMAQVLIVLWFTLIPAAAGFMLIKFFGKLSGDG